jgi:hypothetical protein
VDGGDELVTPLNVITGGLANPQDTVSTERQLGLASEQPEAKSIDATNVKALRRDRVLRTRKRATTQLQEEMIDAFERQRRSVLSKLKAKKKSGMKAEAEDVFNRTRFANELGTDMKPVLRRAAGQFASTIGEWDPENGANYLDAVAEGFAESVVEEEFDRLEAALEADDPVAETEDLFDSLIDNMSLVYATSLILGIGEWARSEAAQASGVRNKTWLTTSGNPRSSHAALDGETVPFDDTFSNGARFPGDPNLDDVQDRANCQCILDYED